MCKVVIKKPEEKRGFIIFNHVYSRKNANFTIQDLKAELQSYGLQIQDADLQKEVNVLVERGVVSQRVGFYKRVSML